MMDEIEIRRHVQGMEQTWGFAESHAIKNKGLVYSAIKKKYEYFPQHVYLYTLTKPVEGWNFVVHYWPTDEMFGFKTWREADIFARERKEHVKHAFRLFGGW